MNQLTAQIRSTRKDIPEGIKRASVTAANEVVTQSPRFSGQLRASTNIGLSSPDLSVVIAPVYEFNAIPDAEFRSMSKFPGAISTFRVGDTIYISNNLHYAWFQEREAGHLMFAKAAQRFQTILDSSF